jgi:hypothetical protein
MIQAMSLPINSVYLSTARRLNDLFPHFLNALAVACMAAKATEVLSRSPMSSGRIHGTIVITVQIASA